MLKYEGPTPCLALWEEGRSIYRESYQETGLNLCYISKINLPSFRNFFSPLYLTINIWKKGYNGERFKKAIKESPNTK